MCPRIIAPSLASMVVTRRPRHYPIFKSDVLDFNSSSTSHFTKCIFKTNSVFLKEDTLTTDDIFSGQRFAILSMFEQGGRRKSGVRQFK